MAERRFDFGCEPEATLIESGLAELLRELRRAEWAKLLRPWPSPVELRLGLTCVESKVRKNRNEHREAEAEECGPVLGAEAWWPLPEPLPSRRLTQRDPNGELPESNGTARSCAAIEGRSTGKQQDMMRIDAMKLYSALLRSVKPFLALKNEEMQDGEDDVLLALALACTWLTALGWLGV